MAAGVRSRNGCFTCRRRKKKCDESLYPECKNCTSSKLLCTWPDHVMKLHNEKELAPAIKNAIGNILDVKSPEVHVHMAGPTLKYPRVMGITDKPFDPQYKLAGRINKPEKKTKNYFLERIAMQQDCVEERHGDNAVKTTRNRNTDIKSRIAQQLDVEQNTVSIEGFKWDS